MVFADGNLYYSVTNPGAAVYWALIVACVYLVRGLSHNVRGYRTRSTPPR